MPPAWLDVSATKFIGKIKSNYEERNSDFILKIEIKEVINN